MVQHHMRKGIAFALAALILSLWIGCWPERGTPISIENRTTVPIIFDYRPVGLDYVGLVTPTVGDFSPRFMLPGSIERYATLIHPNREYGSEEKYIVYALNEAREVVFQHTYTWDELNEMGWKVVIEPQVQG